MKQKFTWTQKFFIENLKKHLKHFYIHFFLLTTKWIQENKRRRERKERIKESEKRKYKQLNTINGIPFDLNIKRIENEKRFMTLLSNVANSNKIYERSIISPVFFRSALYSLFGMENERQHCLCIWILSVFECWRIYFQVWYYFHIFYFHIFYFVFLFFHIFKSFIRIRIMMITFLLRKIMLCSIN